MRKLGDVGSFWVCWEVGSFWGCWEVRELLAMLGGEGGWEGERQYSF